MRSTPLDWEAAGAVLFTEGLPAQPLPVCDHYAGNDKFYRKALELRLQLGDCFDITLDLEDGATVGQEQSASQWAGQCVHRHVEQFGEDSLRPGVRIHPMQHLSFEQDLEHLLRHNQHPPQYLMLPKPQGLSDVNAAWDSISHRCNQEDVAAPALHVLIETHGALDEVKSIAALPFVQSLSFGIMDYVSSFRGAIPKSALNSPDQFDHPLVRQAIWRFPRLAINTAKRLRTVCAETLETLSPQHKTHCVRSMNWAIPECGVFTPRKWHLLCQCFRPPPRN